MYSEFKYLELPIPIEYEYEDNSFPGITETDFEKQIQQFILDNLLSPDDITSYLER